MEPPNAELVMPIPTDAIVRHTANASQTEIKVEVCKLNGKQNLHIFIESDSQLDGEKLFTLLSRVFGKFCAFTKS